MISPALFLRIERTSIRSVLRNGSPPRTTATAVQGSERSVSGANSAPVSVSVSGASRERHVQTRSKKSAGSVFCVLEIFVCMRCYRRVGEKLSCFGDVPKKKERPLNATSIQRRCMDIPTQIHAYIIAHRSSVQTRKCCMLPSFHRSLAATVHSEVCRVMTVSVQNAKFSKKKVSKM